MATLKDLADRIEAQVAATTGINSFVFDDLFAMNENRAKKYPTLLMKPPNSIIPDAHTLSGDYENYAIELYLFDLYHQTERKSKGEAQKWTDLKGLGVTLVKAISDRVNYRYVDKSLTVELGHFQHDEELMAVKLLFNIQVFNCYV